MTNVRRISSRDALTALLSRLAIRPEAEEGGRLLKFLELLEKWNARVNLTASTGWDSLASLFEEAIWAAEMYPSGPARHLDIGSGAGFPALVMRALRPQMRLTLLEPRGKRAAFLETAAHELGLTGTSVFTGRLDEFLESGQGAGWDLVSWKALKLRWRDLSKLLPQCRPETEFWVFHGAVLPLDDASLKQMQLLRRLSFPKKDSWFVSVLRGNVSRET